MTYKILPLTSEHRTWLVDVGTKNMICDEANRPDLYNPAQIELICDKVILDGTGVVCVQDGEIAGAVGGILTPHFMNPVKTLLFEIMWYVHPDHRQTRASYLLMKAYRDMVADRADEGVFTIMGTTPIKDSSLEKLGFKLQEKHYSYRT